MINCYGQHGWKEFHRNRKDILAEFDKILEQTQNRPIQVAHGQGVEAYIRKWLAEFLPKKYAVTSGYIIPNLYDDSGKIYHYDIIIYNCLESPVLWTEGNQDNSEQGKYRAIPAKYVMAVYEVKSRFTKSNITDAVQKLNQTKDFSNQLNKLYFCGMIFIDLKKSDKNKKSILKELHKAIEIFGFSGGMVLRFEEDDTCTGLISFFENDSNTEENSNCKPLAKSIDNLNIYMTEDGNLQIAEDGGGAMLVFNAEKNTWLVSKSYGVFSKEKKYSVHLSWSRSNFSQFCINLLSTLEGLSFNDRDRPSFGMIFDHIETKKALLQHDTPTPNLPFLKISISDEEKFIVNYENNTANINFWVEVENHSDIEVTISDDCFKNIGVLPGRKKAIKQVSIAVTPSKEGKDIKTLLKENLEFTYRLVYYADKTEKEFFSIEKNVRINNYEIVFS